MRGGGKADFRKFWDQIFIILWGLSGPRAIPVAVVEKAWSGFGRKTQILGLTVTARRRSGQKLSGIVETQ